MLDFSRKLTEYDLFVKPISIS